MSHSDAHWTVRMKFHASPMRETTISPLMTTLITAADRNNLRTRCSLRNRRGLPERSIGVVSGIIAARYRSRRDGTAAPPRSQSYSLKLRPTVRDSQTRRTVS